jgi:hypothetical protein
LKFDVGSWRLFDGEGSVWGLEFGLLIEAKDGSMLEVRKLDVVLRRRIKQLQVSGYRLGSRESRVCLGLVLGC